MSVASSSAAGRISDSGAMTGRSVFFTFTESAMDKRTDGRINTGTQLQFGPVINSMSLLRELLNHLNNITVVSQLNVILQLLFVAIGSKVIKERAFINCTVHAPGEVGAFCQKDTI